MAGRVAPDLNDVTEEEVIAQEAWQDKQRATEIGETETRVVFLNGAAKNAEHKFVSNVMVTAKYSPLTFVPRNLFEQFRRVANIYFLIVSCLQLFTTLSPTNKYGTAVPLTIVVTLTMLRELYEDAKRHKSDQEVNNRIVSVLRSPAPEPGHPVGPPSWIDVCWKQVVVGDIVKILDRSEFPADLLLLSSSTERGMCYIETCNLDGETNLKIRSSVEETNTYLLESDLASLRGKAEYELPNNRLYNFMGKITINDKVIPLDVESVLLRGAILRNTKYIHGLVLYTGKESKQMMNSSAAPSKRSNVEITVNSILAIVLGVSLSLCMLCTIMMAVWIDGAGDTWYLPFVVDAKTSETAAGFVTFFILFNNFVPISLYVTMEFVKLFQAKLMDWDAEMYHDETDTPALARTSNLNEELGQIEYIFSDKTGTLTRNEMEFRKCWIGGHVYGFGTTEIGLAAAKRGGHKLLTPMTTEIVPDSRASQVNYDPKLQFDDPRLIKRLHHGDPKTASEIHEFLTLLSVAHTVVPEGDPSKRHEMVYQAESPDEMALVSAARALGYLFFAKSANTVTVEIASASGRRDEQFEVLAVNKFNSARKRMSVIVRNQQNQLVLYVKGADNVIFDRLSKSDTSKEELASVLASFGTEGLRTLVLAKRVLEESMFNKWMASYQAASTALKDRDLALQEVAEEIEKELLVVGATAIEDKLQVGVPDAIATLARADIKIWVLTGDKEETAINIGFACELLTDNMKINIVNAEDKDAVSGQLTALHEEFKSFTGPPTAALVIDGKALSIVEEDAQLGQMLLVIATKCKAVIACRVSPNQKAEIVRLVKNNIVPAPMTLAIGDGANDVSMIQAAHVGIGISGNEGMQAVRSADYAIAQFRFLKRLLLFHGRVNYSRISIVILYSFYKNCALVTTLFFFCIFNAYSGASLKHTVLSSLYNVVWTSCPVVVHGILDRDVPIDVMLDTPMLYKVGQRHDHFNHWKMAQWMLNAMVHACLLYILPCMAFMNLVFPDGDPENLQTFGTNVGNVLAIVVNVRLALEMNTWTWAHIIVVVGSILSFDLVVVAASSLSFLDLYQVAPHLMGSSIYWTTVPLGVIAAVAGDLFVKALLREVKPSASQIVQEQESRKPAKGGQTPSGADAEGDVELAAKGRFLDDDGQDSCPSPTPDIPTLSPGPPNGDVHDGVNGDVHDGVNGDLVNGDPVS